MALPNPLIIKGLQDKILSWYKLNRREFPWRDTREPYHILVSEIMLQQTQAGRVVSYYLRFLENFPDIQALARANRRAVLQLWSGLGYNRRALYLRECAKIVVKDYSGVIPRNYDELVRLPGIGTYTANAILAFAFNKRVPVIDTNIRKALVIELSLKKRHTVKQLEEIAVSLVPPRKSRLWNNAIMDYGAALPKNLISGDWLIQKQKPFTGSERELRGKILRVLLSSRQISYMSLAKKITDSRLKGILDLMVNEGLIRQKKGIFSV